MIKHPTFPVFLIIGGKPCTVVGGGKIASRKVRELLEAGAEVTVIAQKPSQEISELSDKGLITIKVKRFERRDIEGAYLVFAATDDPSVNAEVTAAAHEHHALVNAVDTPELCEFFSGAIVKRGHLRIAVSTSGSCPGLAGQLRNEIEELFPDTVADYIDFAGEMRRSILGQDVDDKVRQKALSWLIQKRTRTYFIRHGREKTQQKIEAILKAEKTIREQT